jgi:hypothetical protein
MSSNGFESVIGFLFIVAFIGGIIYFFYRIILQQEKKLTENLTKIGNKHGLKLEKDTMGDYGQKKGLILKGEINENDFVCYSYSTGRRKSRVQWTAFTLKHNLNVESYSLRLVNENIFRKMGKGLGMVNEIEIGVQDFDNRFLIDSENLSTTRSILNENIRDKITNVPKMYFGELLIGSQDIRYKVPVVLSHDKSCEQFETILETTLLILDDLKRIYS